MNLVSDVANIYTNYIPQFSNIYIVQIFSTDSEIENSESHKNIKNYIQLHAKDINFGEENIQFVRNNATKKFHFSSDNPYTWADDLDIIWDESNKWAVKQYHIDWVSHFYDKESDKFVSGVTGKYRTIIVYVSQYDGKYTKFQFNNVIPTNISGLHLAWTNTPNITSNTFKYKVESFSITPDVEYSTSGDI